MCVKSIVVLLLYEMCLLSLLRLNLFPCRFIHDMKNIRVQATHVSAESG